MKKVFVINDSGHDFSQAKKYGELVIVTSGTINKYQPTYMFREFSSFIESSDKDDYILVCGPTVMNIVFAGMFASKHGRINLLLWLIDGKGENKYVSRTLIL